MNVTGTFICEEPGTIEFSNSHPAITIHSGRWLIRDARIIFGADFQKLPFLLMDPWRGYASAA